MSAPRTWAEREAAAERRSPMHVAALGAFREGSHRMDAVPYAIDLGVARGFMAPAEVEGYASDLDHFLRGVEREIEEGGEA